MKGFSNGKRFMAAGLLLVIVTMYPIFLIGREAVLGFYVDTRYDIEDFLDIRNQSVPGQPVGSSSYQLAHPIEWNGNVIEVQTEDTGVKAPIPIWERSNPITRHVTKVTIRINGQPGAAPTEAWLVPALTKDSDFLSWLHIVKVKDVGTERLAIIQRVDADQSLNKEMRRWRILHITQDKQVREETFSYPERGHHLLGVRLVELSSQTSSFIGYKSDLLATLPNIVFPFIYPNLIFLVGLLLLAVGIRRAVKTSRNAKEEDPQFTR